MKQIPCVPLCTAAAKTLVRLSEVGVSPCVRLCVRVLVWPKMAAHCGAGIAERVSALDFVMRQSLRCRFRTPACAPKQGTLSYLLHLWTEIYMLVPLAETDFVGDFRR